jgi:molybdate transport system permease protein
MVMPPTVLGYLLVLIGRRGVVGAGCRTLRHQPDLYLAGAVIAAAVVAFRWSSSPRAPRSRRRRQLEQAARVLGMSEMACSSA